MATRRVERVEKENSQIVRFWDLGLGEFFGR